MNSQTGLIKRTLFLAGGLVAFTALAQTQNAAITVHADQVLHPNSRYLTGACIEDVNHEVYGGIDSQMIFGESFAEPAAKPPLKGFRDYEAGKSPTDTVSGMWRPIRQGTAAGSFSLESQRAFSGPHSQQISFTSGSGSLGVENQGLDRWGMNFVQGRKYAGYLWARAQSETELFVALESQDGGRVYAEKSLKLKADNWQRLDFQLTADAADIAGRFAVKLKRPGSVALGYAFLQPGSWGRFKDLPVRRDVAEGLINQGVTIMRYGGSMVNNPEYRWKKMIGPRAQRPPHAGHWYPYASDGWGIFDFLNFCEAAGFLGIPDLDINESPQDLADFMDYLNAAPDSEWGRKRIADGHPAPYRLKYIELGNEERVDDNYFEKFEAAARVIWAKDPSIILIVGDFSYHSVIADPFHFAGADSGITTLAAQQKILRLAKQHDREVWFDVHVWTDGPRPDSSLPAMFSYIDALEKIADGANHKVVVFELNANNHSQRRALANALALNAIQRDGRLPITCSANCLQPDGQNDNGWDQGLLFLNPSRVWLQPPGFVTRMMSRNSEPLVVKSESLAPNVDVSATKSQDGKTLVLQVVNVGDETMTLPLKIFGFVPVRPVAQRLTLEAPLDARNTASMSGAIKPVLTEWKHCLENGATTVTFPARSFTVIRL